MSGAAPCNRRTCRAPRNAPLLRGTISYQAPAPRPRSVGIRPKARLRLRSFWNAVRASANVSSDRIVCRSGGSTAASGGVDIGVPEAAVKTSWSRLAGSKTAGSKTCPSFSSSSDNVAAGLFPWPGKSLRTCRTLGPRLDGILVSGRGAAARMPPSPAVVSGRAGSARAARGYCVRLSR